MKLIDKRKIRLWKNGSKEEGHIGQWSFSVDFPLYFRENAVLNNVFCPPIDHNTETAVPNMNVKVDSWFIQDKRSEEQAVASKRKKKCAY